MAFNWEAPIKKSGEEWTPLPEEITVKAALNGRHDEPDLQPLYVSVSRQALVALYEAVK